MKHDRDKLFQCNQCKSTFTSKSAVKLHQMIHTGEKHHQCNHCDKAFPQKNHLTTHLRTHSKEKPYQCQLCMKAFSQISHLSSHQKSHTGENLYQCNHCNKNFASNNNLRRHLMTNTKEKPYQCNHCEKAFSAKHNLKSHLWRNTGEKPHQCSHCDKAFSVISYLRVHQRTHTGEKPYQCSHCNKAYSHDTTLKKHLKTHTGVKSLKFEQGLENYCKTNTRQKSYHCAVCEKDLTEKTNLVKYQRTQSDEEAYLCSKCFKGKGNIMISTSVKNKRQITVKRLNICNKEVKKFKKFETKSIYIRKSESFLKKYTKNTKYEPIQPKEYIIHNRIANEFENSILDSNVKSQKDTNTSGDKGEIEIQLKTTRKSSNEVDEQSKLKLNVGKPTNIDIGRFQKEYSKKQTAIEDINFSDSDLLCTFIKSKTYFNENNYEVDTTQENNAKNYVFQEIYNLFDFLEESTEGAWRRSSNELKQDLHDVLRLLELDKIEDSSFTNIYNLDVNYRQAHIVFQVLMA